MKISAHCHPLLEPMLPKPTLAKHGVPDWLKSMPTQAVSSVMGGEPVRTVKHCPPFIDAMNAGFLIPLATDVHVEGGEVAWDWDPPILADSSITRAPIGLHVPEQAEGSPIDTAGRLVLKFINFWTLGVEDGYSLFFTHPVNRPDLPFQTLTGMVDCDGFRDGYVHFPAILDSDFEGTIKKATPVAQVIPVKREPLKLSVGSMSQEDVLENRKVQTLLAAETGIYRKYYRRRSLKA